MVSSRFVYSSVKAFIETSRCNLYLQTDSKRHAVDPWVLAAGGLGLPRRGKLDAAAVPAPKEGSVMTS
jgi:hypothetical protein